MIAAAALPAVIALNTDMSGVPDWLILATCVVSFVVVLLGLFIK